MNEKSDKYSVISNKHVTTNLEKFSTGQYYRTEQLYFYKLF